MMRATYGHDQRSRFDVATLAHSGTFLIIGETTPVGVLGTAARTRPRSADLLRETVGVVLRGALVGDGGVSGPDDRSSAQGTSRRQPSRGGTSRMMREYHVRICERLGGKFPRATRQKRLWQLFCRDVSRTSDN